ncbi:MAG: type II toxin-antitoxin system mRNA interferase toxin, RelE/StbE family [Candidatus Aenigmatarchaeota archaeon]
MYRLVVSPHADKIFKKLENKNKRALEIIWKKISEILENPTMYKPLRSPLQNIRRVHIDSSFVLLFTVDETKKIVEILDYDHHDKIYRK